jgi:hypothetical protein
VATDKYHNHQQLMTLISSEEKKPGFGIISKNLQVGCQMLQVNRQTATVSLATIKLGMNADQAALIPI